MIDASFQYRCLSYRLSSSGPRPAGLPALSIEQTSRLPRDVSNVFCVRVCNHVGTHIDGPNHFNATRPPLCDWPIETFVFHHAVVLDIPKKDAQLISPDDLRPMREAIGSCDLLLLRTGFGAIRQTDPRRYETVSSGFSAAAAEYLIENLPSVRAIGMDTLSLACPQHMDDGIEAHCVLMCRARRPLFAIEDMNLQQDLNGLNRVFALPLWCEQLDSAPCTVIAEINPY